MENTILELKDKDNNYFKCNNDKKFHIKIKDELNSGEKSKEGKLKYKQIEKSELNKNKETKIKNEIKH